MVKVYFVTNRSGSPKNAPKNFGHRFSHAGVDDLRFGVAEVSGKRVRSVRVEKEKLDDTDDTKSVLGSASLFRGLQAEMRRSKKDAMILLHGFNVSFKEGLVAAGRLAQNHRDTIGHVALFSWPSDGRAIPWSSYKSDRTDARASGPAFARAFIKTAEFIRDTFRQASQGGTEPCGARLHLVAHSMGNYVLRNAFQEVRRLQSGSIPRLFTTVFSMAADEDYDAFEHGHQFRDLPRIAEKICIYFNRGDTALRGSDFTKGNPNRLGTDGPRLPHMVPGNVSNIDVSEIVGGLLEHGYYADLPAVSRDMNEVIRGVHDDEIGNRRFVPSANKYVMLSADD